MSADPLCPSEALSLVDSSGGSMERILGLKTVVFLIEAYLREIAGLVPDHRNKARRNPFAREGSCLQFVKNHIYKRNKAKYVCT